jgi:hypothetical protein
MDNEGQYFLINNASRKTGFFEVLSELKYLVGLFFAKKIKLYVVIGQLINLYSG